jgi:sialic acid synthase SpsE
MIEIIAEAGKNFIISEDPTIEECLNNAKELASAAKDCGADVVKFQCHAFGDERKFRSKERWDWIRFNESLTPYFKFWKSLKEHCDEIKIEFLCTPMSKSAAIKVGDFVKRWKVGSADIVNFELLRFLKDTKKPIIISTGMSTKEQIDKAVKFLGNQIQYLNYCVSLYPCPTHKINLAKVIKLKERYKLPVGFSDHSLSIEAPALAVRMGAVAIEKHFTLNRNAFGPDHKCSLLPDEFKKMVDLCRLAERDGESLEEEKLYWKNFRV